MKHPTLFDVPKDSPSLQDRINAFKEANGIWTYRTPKMPRECDPWCALWVKKFREMYPEEKELKTALDIIGAYASLLEDMDWFVTSTGELAVIRKLCDLNCIPCPL